MVAIVYIVVLAVSNQVIQTSIQDSLVETVQHNIDEIEYFDSITEADIAEEVDYYMSYNDGYLEIDDDFLDELNEVYTSLCTTDGTFLYGENPVARYTAALSFTDGEIQEIEVDGVTYYVYDEQLTAEGLEGLWLRGVVSETRGDTQLLSISRLSLIALPSLLVLAIVGGYLIARRTLRPIQQISDAAENIRRGDDLKQRIDVGRGADELHQLADQFNEMFERLDDSFKVQQQFVSDVSHELRTPLAVICAQCELSLEQEDLTAENREALEGILTQARKMAKMVDDMLDVTRLELHAERYPLEDIDLSGLVEDACADTALLKTQGITLTWEVAEGVHVTGNYELLWRMLNNLISNAYRYGVEQGHIWVTLRNCVAEGEGEGEGKGEGTAVELVVRDDGIGISAEDQEHIFDRFYQADTSRTGEGSGLGLSMVAEIVQFHQGTITVESEPGQGSTFTVVL